MDNNQQQQTHGRNHYRRHYLFHLWSESFKGELQEVEDYKASAKSKCTHYGVNTEVSFWAKTKRLSAPDILNESNIMYCMTSLTPPRVNFWSVQCAEVFTSELLNTWWWDLTGKKTKKKLVTSQRASNRNQSNHRIKPTQYIQTGFLLQPRMSGESVTSPPPATPAATLVSEQWK